MNEIWKEGNRAIKLIETIMPMPGQLASFQETLQQHNVSIQRKQVRTLQINIGKKCDLACHHCHVEAGPKHPDNMTAETVNRVMQVLADSPTVKVLDITGGAPELNPNFRRLCSYARELGIEVYDRCNLTILFEPGQEDTAEFFAEQGITVIASLPCYTADNVEQQRGKGVFDKSIAALHQLNGLGYGKAGTDLILNLVYNPVGTHLPPPQAQLEEDYRKQLTEQLGIEFNALFTITNMPIKRYRHFLEREHAFTKYMQLLLDNFNSQTTADVMCTDMLSVGFDGQLYDCDFNQMLEIPLNGQRLTLWDIDSLADIPVSIAVDNHCYGCTAGAGSSCGGALTTNS